MKVRVTKKQEHVEESPITTEFIKLQDFLKFVNAVGSGGMAKNLIQEGEVQVNGEVCGRAFPIFNRHFCRKGLRPRREIIDISIYLYGVLSSAPYVPLFDV